MELPLMKQKNGLRINQEMVSLMQHCLICNHGHGKDGIQKQTALCIGNQLNFTILQVMLVAVLMVVGTRAIMVILICMLEKILIIIIQFYHVFRLLLTVWMRQLLTMIQRPIRLVQDVVIIILVVQI